MLIKWVRMGTLPSFRMELVTRKTKRLEGRNLHPHPLTSRERRGAGYWTHWNLASRVMKRSGWWEGGIPGEDKEALCPPHPVSFSICCSFVSFIINWSYRHSIFLSSMSHSNKLSNLGGRRGNRNSGICSQVRQMWTVWYQGLGT